MEIKIRPGGEAELAYRRGLEIDERALGPDHPEVSVILVKLGSLVQAKGSYAEAEPQYRRALAINEKTLGASRPTTKINRENLERLRALQVTK